MKDAKPFQASVFGRRKMIYGGGGGLIVVSVQGLLCQIQ
jgi:hypothetical protein